VNPPVTVSLPAKFVTVTSAAPVVPGGVFTLTQVSEMILKFAGTPPKVTKVVVDSPVPVSETKVPPPVGPLAGETVVTVGTAT
jgi:hypothetical protein